MKETQRWAGQKKWEAKEEWMKGLESSNDQQRPMYSAFQWKKDVRRISMKSATEPTSGASIEYLLSVTVF